MTLRHLCTALMLVFFCALTAFTGAESAAVDVKTGDHWFGIYVDGAKQGSLHIIVEKKKGATGEYYSIVGQESRAFKVKDKDVTESYDYKAALGLDLKPISYEALEAKGSAKNTIKAKVTADIAEITIQFGSAAANPPRKVNLTEGDCWSFCAPLMFAARKYAPDKPCRYGKIVEVGCAVISFNVAGSAKTVAFQGADTAATEWVEKESQRFTLAQGEDGFPLWWSETTKAKVTTKYVSEPQEVAKSKYDFDQFQTAPKEETKPDEKKPDEKKPDDKKAAPNLKGTPFKNALKPVASDEDGDDVIRSASDGFSMRMAPKWSATDANITIGQYKIRGQKFTMERPKDNVVHLELVLSVRDKKDKETPENAIADLITIFGASAKMGKVKSVKLDDLTTLNYAECDASVYASDQRIKFTAVAVFSETKAFIFTPYGGWFTMSSIKELEETQDDMLAMIGSFRLTKTE